MKPTKSFFQSTIVASVVLLFVPSVSKAGIFRTCNGDPVVLEGDPTTQISTISFPVGSTDRQDLDNVITHWNNMQGMTLEFDPIVNFSGNYAYDNGKNEIAYQDISGLGLTTVQLDACFWWFESQHIQEFDIEIDLPRSWLFGAPPENTNDGNNSVRYTEVHELGHALGLLDNNNSDVASVMKQSLKGESWSGGGEFSRLHPFGDDSFTARFLYPHSNSHRDIATSAFEVIQSTKNATETMANTTLTVPAGDRFMARGSFSNLGNVTENFDIIYVLSDNTIISALDTVVASGTGNAPPGSFHTFSWTAVVPNTMASGTYSLGLILDPNNRISEQLEGNNVVLLRTRIRVP
jgi:hypothetical protein